jgi:polyisoprenoid-binding protein YceI
MTSNAKWVIDHQHSEIAFKVKHLMISNVKGKFRDFDADINVLNDDFSTADIDLWINTASVNTDDDKRDEHLRSADFFDSSTYQDITFDSTLLEKTSKENIFNLLGELTIKGISLPVKLEVDFGGIAIDPWGNEKAGFSVYGKINRKDWGLTWNTALESGGLLVGEDISIHCEIQLVKPKNTAQAMETETAAETAVETTTSITVKTLDSTIPA